MNVTSWNGKAINVLLKKDLTGLFQSRPIIRSTLSNFILRKRRLYKRATVQRVTMGLNNKLLAACGLKNLSWAVEDKAQLALIDVNESLLRNTCHPVLHGA